MKNISVMLAGLQEPAKSVEIFIELTGIFHGCSQNENKKILQKPIYVTEY